MVLIQEFLNRVNKRSRSMSFRYAPFGVRLKHQENFTVSFQRNKMYPPCLFRSRTATLGAVQGLRRDLQNGGGRDTRRPRKNLQVPLWPWGINCDQQCPLLCPEQLRHRLSLKSGGTGENSPVLSLNVMVNAITYSRPSPLRIEVRVCEGRHLFPRGGLGTGGDVNPDRSPQGVCVVVSCGNKHQATEVCHNVGQPSWERIVCFHLDGDQGPMGEEKDVEQRRTREAGLRATPLAAAGSRTTHIITTSAPLDPVEPPQSLNPFAPNFVPPGQAVPQQPAVSPVLVQQASVPEPQSRSSPIPTVREDPLRRVIHLRVLNDNLVSKELIGDIALDLGTILESCGEVLGMDRIAYVHKRPESSSDQTVQTGRGEGGVGCEGLNRPGRIGVDTWVALRQGGGELRVQILIRMVPSETSSKEDTLRGARGGVGVREGVRTQGAWGPSTSGSCVKNIAAGPSGGQNRSPLQFLPFGGGDRDNGEAGVPVEGADNAPLKEEARERPEQEGEKQYKSGHCSSDVLGQARNGKGRLRRRNAFLPVIHCGPWPVWDELERAGQVKVSTPFGQEPLENRLVAVQRLYNYSALSGYQTGSADEDSNVPESGGTVTAEGTALSTPEWPAGTEGEANMRRGLQYTIWREILQRKAWVAQLTSSSELRKSLLEHPSFGALQERHGVGGNRSGVRMGTGTKSIFDLVIGGIPTSLVPFKRAQLREDSVGGAGGGAFEGGGEESSGLEDVSTSIPAVEVVRLSGLLCCAEYQLQVICQGSGQSWTVLRRYSDFLELYSNLPPSFAAITPPLPPKSWRSLSHLTMTPDFLEERRVALEVMLRRLALNAVRADVEVQGEVRAFLGFPARGGMGQLTGTGTPGHLANFPPHLELSLPPHGATPVSVVGDLRIAIWMLLSGAAKKANDTDLHLQYDSIAQVSGEQEWCGLGGSCSDYKRSATFFQTIDMDVNRTNVRDSVERERVRRVLRTFALQYPDTGYCQAMNFVALFLLRTASGREDICFWLLDALATAVVPQYWDGLSDMTKARTDLAKLRILVGERMPELLEHLDAHGLPLELLVCDWMLSLFCRVLPPTAVLRVWDWLFLEGVEVLLYVALAVLRLAEDDLLAVQGATATFDCLAGAASSVHDADVLIELAVFERDSTEGGQRGKPTPSDGDE